MFVFFINSLFAVIYFMSLSKSKDKDVLKPAGIHILFPSRKISTCHSVINDFLSHELKTRNKIVPLSNIPFLVIAVDQLEMFERSCVEFLVNC